MSVGAAGMSVEVSRGTRARVGVALLIIGDAMFSASIAAGSIYLAALNVLGQYHPRGEEPPSTIINLLLSLLVVAGAAAYWWATRRMQANDQDRFRTGLLVALGLLLVAFVGQLVVLFALSFPAPLHGYASTTILMQAYHVIHLLAAGVASAMVFSRLLNGRLVGQTYLAEVVGYWWYYVAAVGLVFWAVTWFSST